MGKDSEKPHRTDGARRSSKRPTANNRRDDGLARSEDNVVRNLSAGLSFWFASMKAYQSMVDHWVEAREKALVKTLEAVKEINEEANDEKKMDKAADVIIEQLSTFQRDLLAVHLKTLAHTGALFEGVTKPDDILRKYGNAQPTDYQAGADSNDKSSGGSQDVKGSDE